MQATVIGHGADGANILQAPFATLKLFTPQPLPTGTVLDIEAQIATPTAPLTAFSELAARRPGLPNSFSYITDALAPLLTSDPATARDLLQQLPVIGPKFTSGLLFFIAAVKGGDVRDMLGKRTLNRLELLTPELVARLGRDLAALHQNFVESPLADWKAISLPFLFQNDAQPARMYFRQEDAGEQSSGEKSGLGGQRFVLDIHFSELGDVQFDGFIKQSDRAKSFELYMRSAAPLDAEFSQHIREIFEVTTQATGIGGRLTFQHGPEHFVVPQAKPSSFKPGDGTHRILA